MIEMYVRQTNEHFPMNSFKDINYVVLSWSLHVLGKYGTGPNILHISTFLWHFLRKLKTEVEAETKFKRILAAFRWLIFFFQFVLLLSFNFISFIDIFALIIKCVTLYSFQDLGQLNNIHTRARGCASYIQLININSCVRKSVRPRSCVHNI